MHDDDEMDGWIEEVMEETRASFFCFWNVLIFLDFGTFTIFFGLLGFMIFFGFLGFKMQKQTRKYIQGKCVSNTQECQTHQQSYEVATRMYKDQLESILNICKVREAQIYRWKKIMPHNRGETVTQISSFTSQRYKVLWGLAKSDKILLPREVSFYSPPIFYTLLEHWSWGHPKGWWNPQAGLLKKRKQEHLFLVHPRSPKGMRGENT